MSKKFNLKVKVDVYVGQNFYGKNGMVVSTDLTFNDVIASNEEEAITKILDSVPFSVQLPKGLVGSVHEINPINLSIIE